MKRVPIDAAVAVIFFVLLLTLAACGKKTLPVAQPPAAPPTVTSTQPPRAAAAPTIEFSANPSRIERGSQTTLTWKTENATSVVIDGGVGNVEESGSISVSPRESQTFTATATGPGGELKASARVTVVPPAERGGIDVEDIQRLQDAMDRGLVKPVFFAYDSAELSAEAKAILEENARWFNLYPNVIITVEGHCDERGTEEYNLALGDRRAQSARDYLVKSGVAENRLEAISFGEERPFVEGHTEAAWSKNRRAHFSVRE